MTDLLAAALAYRATGWPVLPLHAWVDERCTCGRDDCTSPAKHPRLHNGLHGASADEDTIVGWWRRWPTANVGLRTGVAFDVLDVDGQEGQESILAAGNLPCVPESFTGGGGNHLLFLPTGSGNRAGILPKVDWRGQNGYIVAPPSLHASGKLYEWHEPPETPLQPVPDWLLTLVQPVPHTERPSQPVRFLPADAGDGTPYGLRALDAEIDELARAAVGLRNHSLNGCAFNLYQLVAGGELMERVVEDRLRATASSIGLGDHEISQTLSSARRKGITMPRSAPDLRMVVGGHVNLEPPDPDYEPVDYEVPVEPTYLDKLRGALVRGDDIMSIPPPLPLVDGLLDLDSLALLFGPSGCTKTFVALDLALSVATATWWHGHEVHAGPVLYIVAEGLGGIGARVDAWQQQRRVHSCGESFWLPMAVSLLDTAKVEGLAELVREIRPQLIVVDTFARCLVGGDENTAKDVGMAVENAERLRRASGACVLIVHHSGKDTTLGARGSSALRAAVATEIECSHADGVTILRQTKQKDHEAGEPHRMALVPIGDSCALDRYAGGGDLELPPGAVEMLEDLAAIVGDDEGVSVSVWKVSSGVAERSFYRWQKRLIELGYCLKTGHKGQARYTVTDQGRRLLNG